MKKGVGTRLDGSILVVRIPMRFQRRGGRKRTSHRMAASLCPRRSRSQTARFLRLSRGRGAGSGC